MGNLNGLGPCGGIGGGVIACGTGDMGTGQRGLGHGMCGSRFPNMLAPGLPSLGGGEGP